VGHIALRLMKSLNTKAYICQINKHQNKTKRRAKICISLNQLQKILERRHARLAATRLGQELLEGIDEPWLREGGLWGIEMAKEERPDPPNEDIAYLVRSADDDYIDEHVDDF
jgi:hypothetical protein